MATKPMNLHPNQQPKVVENQKKGLVEGRNRRVLQDIGNLVPDKAAELIKNNKKAVTDGVVAKVTVAQKKVTYKPKPEAVIVISSDDEEDEKKPVIARTRSLKEAKAFTSVLNARSKAASGITRKPKDLVEDIDKADVDNELAVVEYIDDIYKFYKLTEDENRVIDYMGMQPDINAKMRAILVDWLIEVHSKFELMPETLYLTMNILDRYLSDKIVSRKELQLVGISSMLIACKYEEIWAPEVKDFVCISDNAYAREQVLVMEKLILGKLEWYLTVPTQFVFLARYIKASVPSDKEMENMVFFLAELGLMHYSTIISHCPSMIAASAVYAARCTLDRTPFWNETLKHYTGYSETQLLDCAKLLATYHSTAAESKFRAIYKKFLSPNRDAVALRGVAKSLSTKSS